MSDWRARPLRVKDIRTILTQVGPLVTRLYPRGADLLLNRLEDAVEGYATATVMTNERDLPVAFAAETAKGKSIRKISTFWVSPFVRGRGVGASLLDTIVQSWRMRELDRTYVTVRLQRSEELDRLFSQAGFKQHAYAPDRYGSGQHELVLDWNPDRPQYGRFGDSDSRRIAG